VENPTFKNEKIELLVCINEILGELVFKYGISGCSRCLTLETIMNPPPSQIQLRQLFPSHLNHVSLYKLFVKGVSTLQCREYLLDGDRWPVVTPSPVHWVCTCVATGNNQTGVFIKYFRQDSGLDSGINMALARIHHLFQECLMVWLFWSDDIHCQTRADFAFTDWEVLKFWDVDLHRYECHFPSDRILSCSFTKYGPFQIWGNSWDGGDWKVRWGTRT